MTSVLRTLLVLLFCCIHLRSVASKDVVVTKSSGDPEWGPGPYPDITVDIGDRLIFRWNGLHTVVQLQSLADLQTCNFEHRKVLAGPGQHPCPDQPGFEHCIKLTSRVPGEYYLSCEEPGHCSSLAMKLVVVFRLPPTSNATSNGTCTVENVTVASDGYLCRDGTVWYCVNGTLQPTLQSCEFNCSSEGQVLLPWEEICLNGTTYACNGNTAELFSLNQTCLTEVASPSENCSYEGLIVTPEEKVCTNGTLYGCNGTLGQLFPTNESCPEIDDPPHRLCYYHGRTYESGEFLCDSGYSRRCWRGFFIIIGRCTPPQWVFCGFFSWPCSEAYSFELQTTLVFCGRSGSFSTAASLCYPDNGEYYCGNNWLGTGENWIIQSPDYSHYGFPCPRR